MQSSIRHNPWCYIALVACLVACIGDLSALSVFARHYPGYDPHIQPISALGASGSPIAGLVSGWWIFVGVIFLIFALAYGKSSSGHHPEQRYIAWLIGIYAVCEEIGSGIFPGNHVAGHLTSVGIIHNVAGGIGVMALIIAPFIMMKKYTRAGHFLFNRFLLSISLLGLFTFLVFSISRLALPGLHWLRSWHGLWQRLFIANYYVFLVVIAIKLVMEERSPQSSGRY